MQEAPGGSYTAVDASHNNAFRSKKLQEKRPLDPDTGLSGGPIKLGAGVVRQPSRDKGPRTGVLQTNSSLRKAQRKAKWKSS
jgi:hypothetical protein